MIIDVHVHLGIDYTFDEDFKKELLIEKMNRYAVDVQIVQPGTCFDLKTVVQQHNAIAELCREYPGRFFGMANPGPHLEGGAYEDEIARCVEELGFVGIKLHPLASGVDPSSRAGRRAFDAARRHGIPVMVHTGSGAPFADPVRLIDLANEYRDIKIIMAHCGMLFFAANAGQVFASCKNVYGDTSWVPGFLLREWIRSYGPRLMLASDLAENMGTELAKIRTYGFTEQEQELILGKTAFEVFNLKGRITNAS
jgi:hypothetical protein